MQQQPRTQNRPPMTREEREARIRRQKRKRRGRILLVASPVILLVCAIVFAVLSFTVFFKLTGITLTGSETYTQQQVWDASGLRLQDNLLRIPEQTIQENIQTRLPYIQSVSIKRKFPDKLAVTVTEYTEIFALREGEEWLLVGRDCKVLAVAEEKPAETVEFLLPAYARATPGYRLEFRKEADEKDDAYNATVYKVLEQLLKAAQGSAIAQSVTAVDVREVASVKLVYQDRITLKLGAPDDLDARLAWAASVLEVEDREYPNQRGTIDLTIKSEAYVRPESALD